MLTKVEKGCKIIKLKYYQEWTRESA